MTHNFVSSVQIGAHFTSPVWSAHILLLVTLVCNVNPFNKFLKGSDFYNFIKLVFHDPCFKLYLIDKYLRYNVISYN